MLCGSNRNRSLWKLAFLFVCGGRAGVSGIVGAAATGICRSRHLAMLKKLARLVKIRHINQLTIKENFKVGDTIIVQQKSKKVISFSTFEGWLCH
jgi:hypothetical protein